MSTKHKLTKEQQTAKDREENRKFLVVLGLATIALMVLMYLLFR